MNSNIYLFGRFGHGITTSVDDYTRSYFEEFVSKANAPTQIIIHRNGDIMNYGYVRKIEDNNLFGICIQINGQYISKTDKLFEAFENIIANCAVKGDILRLNKNGNLEVTVSNFLDEPEGVVRAIANCQNEILRLDYACRSLPNIDYSTTDNDTYYFKENDDSSTITKTSVRNGYTFIYKERDYDTLALNGYRSTLSSLNKENESFRSRIKEQEHKIKALEKKKKQMGVVVTLLAVLFFGSIFFFNTIEEKNADIETKQQTIDKQEVENTSLSQKNVTLVKENKSIQKEKTDLQSRNDDLTAQQANLRQEYQNLKNKYESIKQENKAYKSENSSLRNKNNTLVRELDKAEKDMIKKNTEYNQLQVRYNRALNVLDEVEKKYYSTKEGKRELKKQHN